MKRTLITGLTMLLLQGCSGATLFYKHLDNLVPGYLDGYVSLTGTQSALLDQQMADLLDWHCATQLNDYANWLRAVNADFQAGRATPARIAQHYAQFEDYRRQIMHQVSTRATELMLTSTDEQVDELFRNLEKKNRKYRAKYIDRAEEQLAQRYSEDLEKHLKRWIGELTPKQRDIVRRWSKELTPIAADRLEMRKRWQARLGQLLRNREDNPSFRTGIYDLLVHPERIWSEGYQRKYLANRKLIFELVAKVGMELNSAQRLRLAERAHGWAYDIDQMACAERSSTARETNVLELP